MKRYGNFFKHVCSFQGLTMSAIEAAKGKKKKPRIALFLQNLENEVIKLEKELLTKSYQTRPYRTFKVYDPKERMICAADFRDRVVHHALCSVLEPIFERSLINDTYACRKEKGTHRAIKRARAFSRRYHYYIKMDVHKFFDSLDHQILKTLLRRKVKDADLLWLTDIFIDHPVPWTAPGKGIPIGNLTSQHFANFYLSGLDHIIKEQLRMKAYIRYMDDLVLFSNEKDALWEAATQIIVYLKEKLALNIKKGSLILAPLSQGLSFLGFRIFPGLIRIQRKGWRRFRRKVHQCNDSLMRGEIHDEQWRQSMASLIGHLQQADTRNLRASFFKGQGQKEVPPG